MNNRDAKFPYKIETLKKHSVIKESLLVELAETTGKSFRNFGCNINKTDYFDMTPDRKYINILKPYVQEVIKSLFPSDNFSLNENECWFQQYYRFQNHNWHNHGDAKWAGVYYLELHKMSPGTQFKIDDVIVDISVNEGDILFFPAEIQHRSPPNKSNYRKTIIGFNLR